MLNQGALCSEHAEQASSRGVLGGGGRLKNYYWPLAVFRTKLSNGQPLSKVVGPLGRPTEKYVNSQTHTEICYGMAVFQYYDIVVSIVANSNEKCIM